MNHSPLFDERHGRKPEPSMQDLARTKVGRGRLRALAKSSDRDVRTAALAALRQAALPDPEPSASYDAD